MAPTETVFKLRVNRSSSRPPLSSQVLSSPLSTCTSSYCSHCYTTANQLSVLFTQSVWELVLIFVALHGIKLHAISITGGISWIYSDLYYLQLTNQIAVFKFAIYKRCFTVYNIILILYILNLWINREVVPMCTDGCCLLIVFLMEWQWRLFSQCSLPTNQSK